MRWRLVVAPEAQNVIRTLSPQTKKYVREALGELIKDPFCGKPLRDELAGLYSFRVRRFRVVYKVDRKIITVIVVAIGRRESIYDELMGVLNEPS